jgi:hypothetical protein
MDAFFLLARKVNLKKIQLLFYQYNRKNISNVVQKYCIGSAQGVHRQHLCKHGIYATVEESGVFRAVRVAPRTLLPSAEVNTFPDAKRQL